MLAGLYWEELYNQVSRGSPGMIIISYLILSYLTKGRRVTQFKCPSSEMLATQPCPVPPTDR